MASSIFYILSFSQKTKTYCSNWQDTNGPGKPILVPLTPLYTVYIRTWVFLNTLPHHRAYDSQNQGCPRSSYSKRFMNTNLLYRRRLGIDDVNCRELNIQDLLVSFQQGGERSLKNRRNFGNVAIPTPLYVYCNCMALAKILRTSS